ncbi:hypothetical protein SAMN02927924_00563 [Sphingobium faniae]|nr:hypothetical protein SAMN02927924_00563 [Sphingobium faniae]
MASLSMFKGMASVNPAGEMWIDAGARIAQAKEGPEARGCGTRGNNARHGPARKTGSVREPQDMTYCVAVQVDQGLVMLSDTRTNAGMDNIARFRKSFPYSVPGERAIVLMCSGNLSITQGVKTMLDHAIRDAALDPDIETILHCPTMHRVAQIVGEAMCAMQGQYRSTIEMQGSAADASILIAGQRKGGRPRLYLVYSAS